MKKNIRKILIVIAIVIVCGFTAYIVYIRFPSKNEKDAPVFSANAIRHEYSSNNMLGLKSITIDGDKYIYEFSAYKYFTRRKVDDLYQSGTIKADGYYWREKTGIVIHQIDDIDVFVSGNMTYVIVVPEKGKGRYDATELFFDKKDTNSKKKGIFVVVFDSEEIGINESVYFYNKDLRKITSQGFSNGKWGKKRKFNTSFWEYESHKYSDLW